MTQPSEAVDTVFIYLCKTPLENLYGGCAQFFFLFSISLSDIAAYEFGRRYGKRKLSENISPNKTVEGFLAGVFVPIPTFPP